MQEHGLQSHGEEILYSKVVCKERICGTWEFIRDVGQERVKK